MSQLESMRNIGISAHIDSGKTTLTERILYYTGRINSMHEVRGKDGVGATMDSMDLEREKGITIQSAATHCAWKGTTINIIDTPGHVDFTIEVERALRVLDGAVLVLCGASGVQSQSITVDRQMKRYDVPRVCFINKLDRAGGDAYNVIQQLREKLHHHAAFVQIPIGREDQLEGTIDLITQEAVYFLGDNGNDIQRKPIPAELQGDADKYRAELIEHVADVDDELAEVYLGGEEPSEELLRAAIRRATIALSFTPVFVGSALKNKGVQEMLDGVISYLPNPTEVENSALDLSNDEAEVKLTSSPKDPLVALAFKLEEGRFGQLTYCRVYQGTLKRGGFLVNTSDGKKVKVPRLIQMHSDSMEDIEEAKAGDICALFGVDCSSGDTFTDGKLKYAMQSMHVPAPVMSYAIRPKDRTGLDNFSKALQRFGREDPTFKVHVDPESKETIISGMGELHLDVYVERMKREYKCDVATGAPQVAYKENPMKKIEFNYLHKKQSGGAGQFARVIGYIEPLPLGSDPPVEFVDKTIGNNIPPGYVSAIEKGFYEACQKGPLIGSPILNCRYVLTDGEAHSVDSSELAFKIATMASVRQCFQKPGMASLLEPIMAVEIISPVEYQGEVMSSVNGRKGMITDTDQGVEQMTLEADVPLANMFGYSSDLRSRTQGKGEFTMEFSRYEKVPTNIQNDLITEYKKVQEERKQEY
eukprot:TRINITY_DN1568_c0_g2_i2.p1 TRINITY_DN1568_c0_g2~~TRINITY_DN1568_c0_g2_i2.p1  ORF type:complete len:702 (-),score=178.83 TRINITY_DN1568_c0_g2_i2:1063-3168(-)